MNSSASDAAVGAEYHAIGGSVQVQSSGVSISMESDDNDSTTAEHEHLLPATPSTSAQQQITTTPVTSTSISMETPPRSSGSRHGSSNILSSFLLGRQRSYSPSTTTSSSMPGRSTAQMNRRLQQSRSVSGNSSMEEPSAAGLAPTPGNVRQLGFWRVNLNEVFSLSTAPSTEALRSFITHSNFRYQPTSAAAGQAPGDNAHILLNGQSANVENNSSGVAPTTSASIRFNNRAAAAGHVGMGRSVSLREGEMHHAQQGMVARHNASVIGLPTAAINPPAYDESAPNVNNLVQPRGGAAEGAENAPGGGAGNAADPAHDHNVDDEHVISDMVVQILSHFVRYLPIICILLIKFIHDHLLGIVDLLILQALMYCVNKTLRTQVARLAQKNYIVLVRDACLIMLVVTVRLLLASAPPDPLGLIVPPPKKSFTVEVAALPFKVQSSSARPDITLRESIFSAQLTANPSTSPSDAETLKATITNDTFDALKAIPLGMLLYYVAVSDIILKLLTMVVKIGITMLPMHLIRLKVRARLYVLVEYVSQFYRALAPITQWFLFLYESYSGLEVISGGLFSSLYLGAKVFELLERGKSLKKAVVTFRRNIDSERQPTKDELDAAGALCPICHDSYNTPVILECGHIFCDECVSTWFKREQTCPMCRAKVSDDPTWQDGATTFFCQLF